MSQFENQLEGSELEQTVTTENAELTFANDALPSVEEVEAGEQPTADAEEVEVTATGKARKVRDTEVEGKFTFTHNGRSFDYATGRKISSSLFDVIEREVPACIHLLDGLNMKATKTGDPFLSKELLEGMLNEHKLTYNQVTFLVNTFAKYFEAANGRKFNGLYTSKQTIQTVAKEYGIEKERSAKVRNFSDVDDEIETDETEAGSSNGSEVTE